MKFMCKCSNFIMWFGYFPTILCAMSLNQYALVLSRQADRTYYQTIPKSVCKIKPYRSIKSCRLLRTNQILLRSLSDKYMRHDFNYWKRVESADVAVTSSHDLRNIVRQTQFGKGIISRIKRSAEVKIRQKRSSTVTYNPCSERFSSPVPVQTGRDANTGEALEIYRPNRGYQTFAIRPCTASGYMGLVCEVTYVVYFEAVTKANSNIVLHRPIKIPIDCALRAPRPQAASLS
uniref:uncharacterized protein LOC113474364 n=1 Tax=Ciona intestinalis TaxID=7719 RepID=UPI000EF4CB12|nr:uncharacterized protein LOC113474364 [Ciona intestinalis]|eukprot:XP_026690902.1 uncharacterized protein LOC113474364 [Ciona intestinalis]